MDAEVIDLLDLTPVGAMEAMIVAEAVLSQRSPPSIMDPEEPGTRGVLLKTDYGIEEEESTGLDISLGIGQGTVLGTRLGLKEMTRICKQKQNGMVVIRNGVMERIIPKSDHPDVIYEEDTNHFYLNGVGKPLAQEIAAIKIFLNFSATKNR